MKKKSIIVISLILLFFGFGIITTKADSGWDSSYDSGSSWNSGSSWDSDWDSRSSWDSDWDSDYSYSGGSSSRASYTTTGDAGTVIIMFAIIAAMIVIPIATGSKNAKKMSEKKEELKYTDIDQEQIEKEIKEVLPDFSSETFKNTVYEIYKEVQIAWMNFDYDTLKNTCTKELYSQYYSQLERLKEKKQKNIMDILSQKNFEIREKEITKDEIYLKVRTTITCYDYVVDEEENVVRGKANIIHYYYYEMTFVKKLNNKKTKCTACGADLDNTVKGVCPYCRSKLTYDSNDSWILVRKEMISQW